MLKLRAFGDLLSRYSAAFRHAWQHRAKMTPVERLPHEAQFLPAALALQETPVSPAPRIAMWLLIAFAVLALLWSVFGRIDVVATAHGRVVPDDRTKVIQPMDTASIKAIHVTDGQAVKAGDVLIELDETMTQADKERVSGELTLARLQVARSQALLSGLERGVPPALEKIPGVDAAKIREAQQLLLGQYGEFTAKRRRIEAEIERREAELVSTQALVRKLEQTAPIARRRAEDFKNLVNKEFVPEHNYLEREQVRIEQEGDLAAQRSRALEIEAALREVRAQRVALVAETRRLALDSLAEGRQQADAMEQELIKADTRRRLLRLTSPVDGTVQQLAVHTMGGVVTPAQSLMVIVPRDNPLEVEAFIENKDIGFVKTGQEAEVKIETFQYTKYGTLHARVASVSHDAIDDEKRGLIYAMRVKMDQDTLDVDGTPIRLSPGMAVTVEIKTGKRRVIEYFLSPLIQHTSESLRER